jgi:uncharacterized protein
MQPIFQSSKYNFLVKVDNMDYLLYNSLRNGLLLLHDQKEIEIVKLIISQKSIRKDGIKSNKEFIDKLIDNGVILDDSDNEKRIIENRVKNNTGLIKNKNLFLTICPTNSCNMACPYCFEEDKPRNERMTDETIERIIYYINSVLHSNPEIEILNITWYGGEPLLGPEIIRKLSLRMIGLAKNNNLEYNADIITNGALLNSKNWKLLEECKIKNCQVTIDGCKSTHNKSRPLVGSNKNSYDLILENLKNKPFDLQLRIRVNVDKEVGENLNEFLNDLEQYNIWPQNAKTINISLNIREKYTTNYFKGEENLLTQDDFFKVKSAFRQMKIRHYNEWAKKTGLKQAKLAFYFPKPSNLTCAEVALPTSFVIDHRGDIYKCWGFVNNKSKVIQNISDNLEKLRENKEIIFASKFNKYYYDKECEKCKYLPICNVDCMWKHTEPNLTKNCCEWKFTLEERLRNQYLLLKNHPEQIQDLSVFEELEKNENSNC